MALGPKRWLVMRILLYGLNYAPELTGVGKFTGEMAAWLAEQGHDVRVIAAPPYYPHWKVIEPYSATRYVEETLDGVRVFRCPLWVPARPGGLSRLLHLVSFALFSLPTLWKQRGWRPDIVLVLEPTFFVTPMALLFAKLVRARSWLHIQDFELDAAFSLGILRGPLRRFAEFFESTIMRRFDKVSSISDAMVARVQQKGVPPNNTMLFPNWVDTGSLQPGAFEALRFRKEIFGVNESERVILYSGNMGEKQGLEIILEAAEQLPSFKFILCGAGAAKARLETLAREKGLVNTRFLPLQPLEHLPALLCAADIHLVTQRKGAADLVMPSKLTGILAVGGASIVTAEPGTELHNIVTKHQVGVAVPAEDPIALTAAIRDLLQADSQLMQFKAAARAYAVQHLNRDVVLHRVFHGLHKAAESETVTL
jgi:colanic acid biosynthesis glycosyl transferase WcaI